MIAMKLMRTVILEIKFIHSHSDDGTSENVQQRPIMARL